MLLLVALWLAGADVASRVWDLTPIYPSPAAWEADRAHVVARLASLGRWRGRVARDPASFAAALDEIADLRRRAGKLAVYGVHQHNLDARSADAQRMYDAGTAVEALVEAAVSPVEGEIRAAGRARVERWLREQPRLERHRRRLHVILRAAPHTPAPEAAAILDGLERWPRGSGDAWFALYEADLGWREIAAGGERVRVDPPAYLRLRRSADAAVRDAAAAAIFDRLAALAEPMGVLYTRRVEAELTLARHRRFPDGLAALRFRDALPDAAGRVVIAAARAHLAELHRYLEVRRRVAGITRRSYADLAARAVAREPTFTLEAAERLILDGATPLGGDYQARMRELLATPWAHLPPHPHKRDYGIWYPVGDAPPRGIMQYDGSFASALAYAGLAQLLVTFSGFPPGREPDSRVDPPVYSNAIIHAGNLLFADAALRATPGDPAILVGTLDRLTRALFRDVLYAELDAWVQQEIARGAPPTGPLISRHLHQLLRAYYGAAVDVDERFGGEWMLNGVFFHSFETQGFPLAMTTACLLVERAAAGDAAARRAFWRLLGRGASDLSGDLLASVGVDLGSPEPYAAAMRRYRRLIGDLERVAPAR